MSTHPYGRFSRRGLAGVLGLGLLDLIVTGEAHAGSSPPLRVHTREEWKAVPPRKAARVRARPPDRIVVHHTATANSKDYSVRHAYRLSREIQRFHMNVRGWDDTGQQLTISRGGHVMEGRNRSLAAIRAGRHVVGAQALHHNEHTLGIENEGDYSKTPVPGRLWSALTDTCAWLCAVYELDPFTAIVGHRDLVTTDCPGDVLYARIPELRVLVSQRLTLDANSQDSRAGDGGSAQPTSSATPLENAGAKPAEGPAATAPPSEIDPGTAAPSTAPSP